MKHWQETSRIVRALARLVEEGRRASLATVVRIRGSAYRRPGAKMLISDDGAMAGTVSGGCLEADVREIGLSALRSGKPQLLHYDTGGDDATPWGLGLGCNGAVDIFVQPANTPELTAVWTRVGALLGADAPFSITTVVAGAGMGRVRLGDADPDGVSQLHDVDGAQVFTEVLTPPPHVLIIGAGEDSRPLAAFAAEAGFRVTVVDHRPAYLDAAHYPPGTALVTARAEEPGPQLPLGPRTYAVVKTHSLAHDRAWVERLLATDVPYIGVLGPRSRIDDVLRQLGAEGNERVFGPVGFDLGAEGPEQIALSIVAELLAARSGRTPGHLRERPGAIHAG